MASNSTQSFLHNESESDDEKLKTFDQMVWLFTAPIIFIIGICGNFLILLVMGRRGMTGTSASVYLRWMAAADICVLISGMIPEWLEHGDFFVLKYIHPVYCKLEKFIFYSSADTAIWVLCIFSFDRFIAVCFPFEKRDYCLPSRSKYFAIGALLLAITKNLHVFWTRGAEYVIINNTTVLKSNCGRPTESYKHFELYIRPWIAFAVVNVLPFCTILFCNVFIIKSLMARKRNNVATISASDLHLVQMSLMCLSASFSFLICITPSIILLIGRPHWQHSDAYYIAKSISNQIAYVNHSINFFLYCVSGKRFRSVLVSTLCCKSESVDSGLSTATGRPSIYKKLSTTKSSSLGASPRPSPKVSHRELDRDGAGVPLNGESNESTV
jgi:hypothetical protein